MQLLHTSGCKESAEYVGISSVFSDLMLRAGLDSSWHKRGNGGRSNFLTKFTDILFTSFAA